MLIGPDAIATAAKQIIVDNMAIAVAGGVESISMVQTEQLRVEPDPLAIQHQSDAYMSMLDTADMVARRYGIGRDACDAYALAIPAAHGGGPFRRRDRPPASRMKVVDQQTGDITWRDVLLQQDEGARADTTAEGLAGLRTIFRTAR